MQWNVEACQRIMDNIIYIIISVNCNGFDVYSNNPPNGILCSLVTTSPCWFLRNSARIKLLLSCTYDDHKHISVQINSIIVNLCKSKLACESAIKTIYISRNKR